MLADVDAEPSDRSDELLNGFLIAEIARFVFVAAKDIGERVHRARSIGDEVDTSKSIQCEGSRVVTQPARAVRNGQLTCTPERKKALHGVACSNHHARVSSTGRRRYFSNMLTTRTCAHANSMKISHKSYDAPPPPLWIHVSANLSFELFPCEGLSLSTGSLDKISPGFQSVPCRGNLSVAR